MSFALSRATPEHIPGIVEVFYNAFESPEIRKTFPNTPAVNNWLSDCFKRAIEDRTSHIILMVMIENNTRRVAAYTKWIVQQEGVPLDWKRDWSGDVAEGMTVEKCDDFFLPMARGHASSTKGRKHLFLEVLATHSDFRKKGLASQLLQWGVEYADREGIESYLDASPAGKPLYEKFGFVHQREKQDKDARSAVMLRPAKKTG